jgi:hypothetical protein
VQIRHPEAGYGRLGCVLASLVIFNDVGYCFNICVPEKVELVPQYILILLDTFEHLKHFLFNLTEPDSIVVIDADGSLDEVVDSGVKIRVNEGFGLVKVAVLEGFHVIPVEGIEAMGDHVEQVAEGKDLRFVPDESLQQHLRRQAAQVGVVAHNVL